jgi:hypothetical protein
MDETLGTQPDGGNERKQWVGLVEANWMITKGQNLTRSDTHVVTFGQNLTRGDKGNGGARAAGPSGPYASPR